MTILAPAALPTFPARPVNGGPLPRARAKHGHWLYEPKYNGWRAEVHAPTRTMFNRHGAPLSIAVEFAEALAALEILASRTGIEWFDCEGLERRHAIGRGCLFVLDFIPHQSPFTHHKAQPPASATFLQRSALLDAHLPRLPVECRPDETRIYRPDLLPGTVATWEALQRVNREWGCEFYEGLVAKRGDSIYPMQLRSASLETASWMKHRWAF